MSNRPTIWIADLIHLTIWNLKSTWIAITREYLVRMSCRIHAQPHNPVKTSLLVTSIRTIESPNFASAVWPTVIRRVVYVAIVRCLLGHTFGRTSEAFYSTCHRELCQCERKGTNVAAIIHPESQTSTICGYAGAIVDFEHPTGSKESNLTYNQHIFWWYDGSHWESDN